MCVREGMCVCVCEGAWACVCVEHLITGMHVGHGWSMHENL